MSTTTLIEAIKDDLGYLKLHRAVEVFAGLAEAARTLGVARQTVVHKVQRGELEAVYVSRGKRKGLRINVNRATPGLFATTE